MCLKATAVRGRKLSVDWRGFLVTRQEPELISASYHTKIRFPQGWLVEMAGSGYPALVTGKCLPACDRIETSDAARGEMRFAVVKDGELQAALYISRGNGLPSREWLISQLGGDGGASSMEFLAGRSEEHTSELQSLMRISYAVFCLKKKNNKHAQ